MRLGNQLIEEGQVFAAEAWRKSDYIQALVDNGVVEDVEFVDGDWVGKQKIRVPLSVDRIGIILVPCESVEVDNDGGGF
jgi:hypothetical protein